MASLYRGQRSIQFELKEIKNILKEINSNISRQDVDVVGLDTFCMVHTRIEFAELMERVSEEAIGLKFVSTDVTSSTFRNLFTSVSLLIISFIIFYFSLFLILLLN